MMFSLKRLDHPGFMFAGAFVHARQPLIAVERTIRGLSVSSIGPMATEMLEGPALVEWIPPG
jgi:hypothetical protein